jgi:hypothetical protein
MWIACFGMELSVVAMSARMAAHSPLASVVVECQVCKPFAEDYCCLVSGSG